MKRCISLIAALLVLAGTSRAVDAAEGLAYGGPLGGTDLGSAYLPPQPGLYGGMINVWAQSSSLKGDDGKTVPGSDAKFRADIIGLGLMYVYPFQLAGGTVASSIIQPITAYGHAELFGDTPFGREQTFRGVGDLYADLFMWSKHIDGTGSGPAGVPLPYGLTVKAAASMIFPTGEYDKDDLVSPGHNLYYFLPNVALTYLFGPNMLGQGFELSSTFWYEMTPRNDDTDVKSGDVYNIDWAATQMTGPWQYGLAGNYAKQVEDDDYKGDSVLPNGNRLLIVGVGPVVSRVFPELGLQIKAKANLSVDNENALKMNAVVFSFIKQL